ncbi:MAG: ABC transporter permease, partial [Nitrosopumilaceae archaeon]
MEEFKRNKIGLVGIGILATLVITSIVAAAVVPAETFQQWNNPASWISYPKTSQPIWVNYFLVEKIP